MEKLKVYFNIGVGPNHINTGGRGEIIYGCRVSGILDKAGHSIHVMDATGGILGSDAQEYSNNAVMIPDIVSFARGHGSSNPVDVVISSGLKSDSETGMHAELNVKGKIYLWESMGPWPTTKTNWNLNDYVIKGYKSFVGYTHGVCNIGDRDVLLAFPYGEELGASKFSNRRIGCAIKFLFHHSRANIYGLRIHEIASRFFDAIVNVSNNLGAGITIFCSEQYTDDPTSSYYIKAHRILEKLSTVKDVKFVKTCSPREFIKELCNCSVVFPLPGALSGSAGEAIFYGITPVVFRDSFLFDYGDIQNVAIEMTEGSETKDYSQARLEDKFMKLLTDEVYYNYFLSKLQVHFKDHTNAEVLKQFNNIVDHARGTGALK